MKKILFSLVASLMLISCGTTQTTTSTTTNNTTTTPSASKVETKVKSAIDNAVATNNSESFTAGQQSGVALKALYSQYKADGKLDLSNLSNVANIMNVAAQAQKIKNAEKGSVDYKDFSKGLVEGSTNLISGIDADKVVDTLKETASSKIDSEKITEAKDKTQTAVGNITEAAASISEIIKLFKQ